MSVGDGFCLEIQDDGTASTATGDGWRPGMGLESMAERLALSAKTVANHISAIFAKLQVADRTQAILRARDAGLGPPNQPDGACPGTWNSWDELQQLSWR